MQISLVSSNRFTSRLSSPARPTSERSRRSLAGRVLHAISLMIVAPAVLVGLSGCGGEKSLREAEMQKKIAPLPPVTGTGGVSTLWTRDVGGDFDSRHYQLVPALSGSTVYAAGTSGTVKAFSAETGDSVWESNVGERITAGVGAGTSLAVVATREGNVVALDANTGKEVWRTYASGEVLAQPVIAGDVVLIRTSDGKVIGFRATDGKRAWGFQRAVPGLSLRGTGRPVIFEGVAVNGFANGKIVASELDTGRVLWEIGVSKTRGRNEIERLIDIDAQPVLIGSVLYTAAYQGEVTALALGSRRVLWRAPVSSYRDIGADDDSVFVSTEEGSVIAIDRLTGAERWRQDALEGRNITGPASAGGTLVVGDGDGQLHVLDKSTGALTGRISVRGRVAGTPQAYGSTLYMLSESGALTALTATGG